MSLHKRFNSERRFNGKAKFLGIDDPFSTQIIRYETGAGYGAAVISAYEGKKANKKTLAALQAVSAQAQKYIGDQYEISQGWLSGQNERNMADVNAQNEWLSKLYSDRELLNNALVERQNVLNTQIGERQAAQNRADYAPWMTAGSAASKETADLQGLNGPEAQAAAKARFQFEPGRQFRQEASQRALERSAAGQGGLFSGRTGLRLQENEQNLASNEYANAYARLMNISQLGLGASGNLAGLNTENTARYAGMNNANRSNLWNQNNANMGNLAGMRNANTIGQVDRGNQTNYFRIGLGNEYAANKANAAMGMGGIQSNYYQAQAQNLSNMVNRAAQYTDTTSSNMFNRGMSVASMVGSKGMAGGQSQTQDPYRNQPSSLGGFYDYGSGNMGLRIAGTERYGDDYKIYNQAGY